jgi:adenine phosphoribosyltransferase
MVADAAAAPAGFFHPTRPAYRFVNLLFISSLSFGSYFAYDIIGAIAPSLIEQLDASRATVGAFNTMYSVAAILVLLFAGVLIDRLGTRKAGIIFSVLVLTGAVIVWQAKSIPLIHAQAVKTHKPYVVLRKVYRPYMGEALSAETHSITTGKNQCLYLDEKDRSLLAGKRVVLLDDVISTGSTLRAMEQLMGEAQAIVTEEAGILTEGDQQQWMHIVALGHVPIYTD